MKNIQASLSAEESSEKTNANVIVTGIGTISALSVLENLRNIGNIKITGTDIHPPEWQTNLRFLDKFYRVPRYDSDDYISFMLEICLQNCVNYVFPLTDDAVDVLNRNKTIFESRGITICISPPEALSRCRDKSKLGSDIPSFSPDKLQDVAIYPIIAKLKNGGGGRGQFKLENPAQLAMIKNMENYVFQSYIAGQVITTDVVRDKWGNTVSVSRKELRRTDNGAGTHVEIFEDSSLKEIVLQTAIDFNILGCVNFEHLYSNGKYYLMDVNPRFSTGIGFSCLAGYNFVKEHLNVFQNKKISELQKIRTRILALEFKTIAIQ